MPQGTLTLRQEFQVIHARLGSSPITDGRVHGNEITFSVGRLRYTGYVNGSRMEGTVSGGSRDLMDRDARGGLGLSVWTGAGAPLHIPAAFSTA